ncbi:unnamed protein product, partial [Ectocarpus sp. 12 AP-2014]
AGDVHSRRHSTNLCRGGRSAVPLRRYPGLSPLEGDGLRRAAARATDKPLRFSRERSPRCHRHRAFVHPALRLGDPGAQGTTGEAW